METLLVTGHLGFIGSSFCHLYSDQFKMVGVDFLGWGAMKENLAQNVVDEHADISNGPAMEAIFKKYQPDAIINFAAESHVDRSIENDLSFWKSNVLGARELALQAHRRKIRMLHVSTDEVYGDADHESKPWTEQSPISPKNPYAVTKAAAEHMLMAYHRTLGLDVVITRGGNTIGPRQYPEKAIPKAVLCFLNGNPFPLFKTPARRMWLYAEDHCSGIRAALKKGRAGEAYNIAPASTNEEFTYKVIEQVREIVGRGEIEITEDRKAYDLRYWMSAEKAARELDWQPRFDLKSALAETVGWYLENPTWMKAAAITG